MSEYKKPSNPAEFAKNFKQKKPLMNQTEAHFESARCLFCYDAPCMDACPTGIDIPLFIKQIHTENVDGAAKTIYDSNWMGNACGTVCPTGVLCEGACVYNHQDVLPVQIGRLQNYATDKVISAGKKLFTEGADTGFKVAVIGAGPGGVSCAAELRTLGVAVEIFEAKGNQSGLLINGVAPYKISNEEVQAEMDYLQNQLNYQIHYNSPIETEAQIAELEANFDAVFIGVGLGATAERGIPGEVLDGVIGAVEFIEALRMNHENTPVGNKVVVLGGGNTAMDAASESARMGASEVTLAYRGTKEKMGAYEFEYDLALSAGVKFLFEVTPIQILESGRVSSVRFANPTGDAVIVECDQVIMATGQAKCGGLFELISDLELDESQRIKVNPESNQTSNPKYFAGGDAINGGAEVVNAAYDGKLAANGILAFLTNKK